MDSIWVAYIQDDVTEDVTEHSSWLQLSINLHAPVTAALVPNVLHRRDESSGRTCAVIETL